jgi:Acetyl xylan esterase (AXE1)
MIAGAMHLHRCLSRAALVAAIAWTAGTAAADTALFPTPAASDTPRAQLDRWLTEVAHGQLRARAKVVAGVTTAAALEDRRRWTRETFLRLIGGLPAARTPLRARVTGRHEREGFSVENVLFESQPGFAVTANVYVPARPAARHPALIVSAGHYDLGKAEEREGPDLARKGFVVLAYDPLGQGERLQHYDPELRASRAGAGTEEHGQAAARRELIGQSVARDFIWDAMRGLDYLASRPDVDAERLGATGCSGGGTVTTYLTALDARVKAAAVSCYTTSWDAIVDGPGPQEAEQSLAGFLSSGMDMADFVGLIAPRPLLIVSTTEDFFPVEGARAVFEEGRRLYALAGADDRISWSRTPGGHGVSPQGRLDIARFFRRWLADDGGEVHDETDARLSALELQATETGQAATALGARTIADLVAEDAAGFPALPLPADAAGLARHREQMRAAVADLTGQAAAASAAGVSPVLTVLRSIPRPGYRLDVVSFPVGDTLSLSALLAVPDGAGRHAAVLLADPRVRAATAEALPADLDALARGGQVVLAVELRGAITAADPPARPSLLGPLLGTYRRASVVGKSLAGMRTGDVLQSIEVLAHRPDVDPGRIDAIGRGPFAIPVLQAAVLDLRLARVALEGSPVSYRAVIDHSIHKDLPESLMAGVLRRYDVGLLLLALAPRPVAVVDPVDAVGQPMAPGEVTRYLGDVLAVDARIAGSARIHVVRRARGAAFRWE